MTAAWTLDILRVMSRFIRHGFRFLAALFGILALLVMAVAWRVAYVPINSTTLTPYIEKALSQVIPGAQAQVGKSTLIWDNAKQALSLSCQDVAFSTDSGEKMAAFQSAEFKIKLWQLLSGSILPQEFVAQHATFWLVRDQNGLISFGTPEAQAIKEKGKLEKALDFTFLQFIADEIASPRLKHTINISDVVFNVTDKRFGEDWSVTVPNIKLTHDKTMATGDAKIELKEDGRTSYLQLNYAFDQATKLHNVVLNFQDIKPSAFAAQNSNLAPLKIAEFPVSGSISLSTDRDLNVSKVSVALDGGKGFLNDETLWDEPRMIEKLVLRADYAQAKDRLEVSKAEIDFGGPKLNLKLDAKIPPPKDLLWLSRKDGNNAFTMTITLDNLPMNSYAAIWPKTIIPDARSWIASSLSKGEFVHGEVTIHGKADLNDLENVVLESGGGKITARNGRVSYLDGMPAVENAHADAVFDLNHMDITITSGNTGAIKIQPFTLVIDKFQEDIQTITIPIRLVGPVKDVLTVLDSKPLGYATAIGLSPNDSAGQVEGTLTLHMPLLDSLLLEDVGVKAQAKITGFGAQKLVPGIEISQGNLNLDLTGEGFGLKGSADLNKVPAQIVWDSVFDQAKSNKPLHDATITATVKGKQWADFYGLGTLAKVTGDTPVTIKYTNVRKGFSKVSGAISLKGAAVRMKDIGWDKPASEADQLSFALDIPSGKNMLFRSIELQGPTVKVKGMAELDHDSGKLLSMAFKPFILGRSNANVTYERPLDVRKPLTITVEGESFDITPIDARDEDTETKAEDAALEKGSDPEEARPRNYRLQLVKLYTSTDGFMGSIKGHAERDSLGWKDIDLWGIAQGSTPVTVKLQPDGGRSIFQIDSDNFGTALQGFGYGAGIKGGKIEVNGQSTKEAPRTINGKIKIDSFVVSDLPVLARLLSAVSPFGFMDLITGDAAFDRLLAHYKWHGDDVDLSDVRASGSVVGINLGGRVNVESGNANLTGTLVPFSFVNSIIGSIPLLGDVITGGSGGGVIAASFSVRGPLSDPDISVNPVSLLTPGILRSLFFSSSDTTESEGRPTAPEPDATPATPLVSPRSESNFTTKENVGR